MRRLCRVFAEGPRFGSSFADYLNHGFIDTLPKFGYPNRMVATSRAWIPGGTLQFCDPRGAADISPQMAFATVEVNVEVEHFYKPGFA